jgi:hypothetical protein
MDNPVYIDRAVYSVRLPRGSYLHTAISERASVRHGWAERIEHENRQPQWDGWAMFALVVDDETWDRLKR